MAHSVSRPRMTTKKSQTDKVQMFAVGVPEQFRADELPVVGEHCTGDDIDSVMTEPPGEQELHILRDELDPQGIYLKGG